MSPTILGFCRVEQQERPDLLAIDARLTLEPGDRASATDPDARLTGNRYERLRRELSAPYALLTLEDVHDLDRAESYCFSILDPSSPQVDEICRLSDALEEALSTIPALGSAAAAFLPRADRADAGRFWRRP